MLPSRFRNAKRCNAIDFCISAVWESHYVKKDSDVICDDCKKWVDKARKMIEDKKTLDEIVEELKWVCDKIPMEPLKATCEKLVDDNVPEILKMLESAMDPEAICTKLQFCSNAKYDKSLMLRPSKKEKIQPFTCGQCHHIGSIIEQKFNKADRDDILEMILGMCGEMSSFSDACSSTVLTYFDQIYNKIGSEIKSQKLCSSSGACANHGREGIVDITPALDETGDAVTCQLCEQLAQHLRELLITNTTKAEFKNIMIGFCHQMGKFSDECVAISDQYSDIVYEFLNDKLNASKMCTAIKVCPPKDRKLNVPSMPLVSPDIYPSPIDRSRPVAVVEIHLIFDESSLQLYKNGSLCTICEYFVHYLQVELRDQAAEDAVVEVLKRTCKRFPKNVEHECEALLELYGDAMMSFLDQDLDPRFICPKIKLCPPNLSLKYLQETAVDEKPTCPFCLFAIQEVREVIASNSSKQNIQSAVSRLCNHLSDKLMGQCTEFVKKYSDEVVEMLLADFTPQEACTFIKLCTDDKPNKHETLSLADDSEDFDENPLATISNPQCELCKEIVKIVEQRVINKKSKDEIRRELENSCGRLKKFADKCKKFVDTYSDMIVDLIEKELAPEEVCRELIFCTSGDELELQDYDAGLDILAMATKSVDEAIKEEPQCVICEFVMAKLEKELNDKSVDEEVKHAVRSVCAKMPATVAKSCKQFVDYYFDVIIILIETTPPKKMCTEMKLCSAQSYEGVMVQQMHNEIVECAICKGLVAGIDTVVEDPYTETNLENLEQKLCEKFAGKYLSKVCSLRILGLENIFNEFLFSATILQTPTDLPS